MRKKRTSEEIVSEAVTVAISGQAKALSEDDVKRIIDAHVSAIVKAVVKKEVAEATAKLAINQAIGKSLY